MHKYRKILMHFAYLCTGCDAALRIFSGFPVGVCVFCLSRARCWTWTIFSSGIRAPIVVCKRASVVGYCVRTECGSACAACDFGVLSGVDFHRRSPGSQCCRILGRFGGNVSGELRATISNRGYITVHFTMQYIKVLK